MPLLNKVLIACLLFLTIPPPVFSQPIDKRPNVVLILTDDQGWGDLGSNGNKVVRTPVLDGLAREGASFSQFYVSPLCAPTRASLLTGRYHLRTGAYYVTKGTETIREEEVTLAEVFKGAGYATGCYGKWHNGAHFPNHPNGQGFDQFFGFCAGHLTNYFDTSLEHNGKTVKTKGFVTDVLTDSALAFIEKNKNRPFFCYIPYNAPHSPYQVPDVYFDRHKKQGLNDTLASVYGMVENVDQNVGRILHHLQKLRLDQNTIVVFLTDNGPQTYRYNGGMKGKKGSVDEGGVRVPLFIRYPEKIKPNSTVASLTASMDVMPTLMELCGVTTPVSLPLDGMSLVPLLNGKTETFRTRSLFTHVSHSDKLTKYPGTVRKEDYLLVLTSKENHLYNLRADPAQRKDCKAENPALVGELTAAYESWFAEVTRKEIKRSAIPVVARMPLTELPAHEAFITGSLQYKAKNGYAHDWLVNWSKAADARCYWELAVEQPGTYTVAVLYNAHSDAVGASFDAEIQGVSTSGKIRQSFMKDSLPSPDRVRRIEAYEKEWATMNLGPISLPRGTTRLTLKTPDLPAGAAIEVKAVQLKKSAGR